MKYSDNQMLLEYVKGRVIFCFYIFEHYCPVKVDK